MSAIPFPSTKMPRQFRVATRRELSRLHCTNNNYEKAPTDRNEKFAELSVQVIISYHIVSIMSLQRDLLRLLRAVASSKILSITRETRFHPKTERFNKSWRKIRSIILQRGSARCSHSSSRSINLRRVTSFLQQQQQRYLRYFSSARVLFNW